MMGWQWHQLDHMQIICTSLQTDNHASTSPLNFTQARCPSCHLTNSIKALKAIVVPVVLQKNSYFAGRYASIASSNGGACTMLKMLFQVQSIICRLFLYVRSWCVQVRCHNVSSTRKTGWNVRLCCREESGGSPHSLGAGKPAGW